MIQKLFRVTRAAAFLAVIAAACFCPPTQAGDESEKAAAPLERPDFEQFGPLPDDGLQTMAKNRQIVYDRLSAYLVDRLDLSTREGIGIDLGSGPGDLVVRLASSTKRFYWINADINTGYARPFAAEILAKGIAHRTGFIFADACALPFRDNYADVIVSRGSYQFWGDLEKGLAEIRRVLRPGGEAFIGRGVPPTMPEEEVAELAARKFIGGPKYDPDADAARFGALMQKMNIREFEVIRHKASDPELNYGVWLYFKKASE
jgi:SAM-dependent methyltransferase